jgi:O-antigen ligase
MCGVGVILALHAASGREEPWPVRALATGALPLLALTLYLTFSRGAIAATILGAAVYAIAARPRRLPATLLVGGTATWVALSTAYRADLIGTVHYRSPAGLLEGHHVARVVVWAAALALLARLLLVPLEHRLDRLGGERPVRPRVAAGLAAGALMLALIVALAAGAPHRLRVEIDAFSRGNTISETGNARDRLGAVGNNGRLGLWRVARADAREHRFHGSGAGTFRVQWLERRPSGILLVNDAHSLYLETLAELGIVGFALLCVALGGVLVAALVRALGPLRGPAAAVLAAGVAVAAHAGIDWDWEMPALMVWLWAAGGMLLARGAERAGAAWEPPRLTRVVAGLLCLLVALMPFLVARSQAALDRSTRAFDRGDCPQAVDAALDSLDALRVRSQPYEVLAWCDGRAGQWTLAIGAMRAARARDPLDWRYAYGLAVVEAAAGQDPRGAVRDALRLNPRYAQVQWLARAMRGHSRARWQRAAFAAQLPVNG